METLERERRRHASSSPQPGEAAAVARAEGLSSDGVLAAVALTAIGIGTCVRLWLLLGSRGAITGDEAVVGLMARHVVAHGQIDAFFWGQHYGGTLEVLLTAPFVAVLGNTALALRILPLALLAASCAVTYLIARRVLDRGAALCAAALLWSWPANLVWHTSREWGFYGAALLLGLAM